MEHAESQKKKSSVTLELFGQGGITTFWNEIESAIMASIPDDPVSLASMTGQLRSGKMGAWGIWKDGKVAAILVTAPVNDGYTGRTACAIQSIHGHLEDVDWTEAARQLENVLRGGGFSKIVAWSDNERVTEICKVLGWPTRTLCWREL